MLTRRNFMNRTAGAAATAATAMYLACGAAGANTGSPAFGTGLRTFIGGAPVEPSGVVEWERRRLSVAAARLSTDFAGLLRGELDSLLGRFAVAVDDIAAARSALSKARALIGSDGLRELLAAELAASEAATRTALAASGGQWAISTTEIVSDRGSAAGFVQWFGLARTTDARAIWTDACPDHYIIATLADGRQEVVEVTGGAVLASRFFVDYADSTGVPVSADPAYPLAVAGTAALADGTVVGGVRHQFRDEPGGGFRSRLAVAFPAAVPGLYIAEHEWHLACEFGNWITAYLR
ncbi:hypothetical protein ACIA5H_20760 [Nocardia sp. NPDC051900]|uniref:hypothetical protein n=1 Tax=Nocardia sp. NPDC051900 TaxID=3364326 RepID=UPI00378EF2BB